MRRPTIPSAALWRLAARPPARRLSSALQTVPNDARGHPDIIFKVGVPNASLADAFALVEPTLGRCVCGRRDGRQVVGG
eukprot:2802304-Prymnesium_polylepis.1